MKQCKKCNQIKPLTEYCVRKGEIDGKHRYCKLCLNSNFKTYYHTSGRKNSEYYKTYRKENKEYFNNYCTNHYHTNKELYREWNREKYATDIPFKIKHITSSRIHEALKTYQTLKKDRTIEYLGCSIGDYCNYLESKFDGKMNWDNQGDYWHIDHIKPIASFDLNNEKELYKCFHYTNTQPMEALENRLKSDKYSII
jgi:hypothetical protein|tara:strand:+ start:68 stop:658 length:591 start_codon:yes stop_codon:yes gene_type:complete